MPDHSAPIQRIDFMCQNFVFETLKWLPNLGYLQIRTEVAVCSWRFDYSLSVRSKLKMVFVKAIAVALPAFNLVKNQSRRHAKKVKCSSTSKHVTRAQKQTENVQNRYP